jgi:hypothetical protein
VLMVKLKNKLSTNTNSTVSGALIVLLTLYIPDDKFLIRNRCTLKYSRVWITQTSIPSKISITSPRGSQRQRWLDRVKKDLSQVDETARIEDADNSDGEVW